MIVQYSDWIRQYWLYIHGTFHGRFAFRLKHIAKEKFSPTSWKLICSLSCYWRNKTRKLRNIKMACQFYLSVWWTYMCFLRASGILKVIPHSAHTHDFSVSGNKTNIMHLDSAKLFNISFSYINEMFNCEILKPSLW